MPSQASEPKTRRGWLFAGLFALGLTLLFVPLSLSIHTGNDEGMWLYIARIWVDHGLAPYAHAVENKTPGIFLVYALSYLGFGLSLAPLRVLGILAIVLGSLGVAACARRLKGPEAARFAQIAFGLMMGWRLLDGRYTAQTETFLALFSTLSLLALIRATDAGSRAWLLASATLLGAAIAFKQVAIFSVAGWLAYYLLNAESRAPRRVASALLSLAAGIAAANLASLVPLLLSGVSLRDYLDGAWAILLGGGSSRLFRLDAGPLRDALAHGLAEQRSDFLETWGTGPMAWLWLATGVLLVLRFRLLRERRFLGALAWLGADFLGANASGFYFGHQLKQIVPLLSLLLAWLLADLLARLSGPRRALASAGLALALAAFLFPREELQNGLEQFRRGAPDRGRELGRWLDANAPPEAYVFVADLGCNSVLAHSRRRAPGRYFNTVFLSRRGALEETLASLEARPPTYIVKHFPWNSVPPELRKFIERRYRPVHTYYGYALYQARGGPA